jgi:hypothetical protein
MKIAAKDIAAALKPLSFQMQSDQSFVYFVRPNATTAGLFERLECVYVGRPPDTIVLAVSLSVVQRMALQFRGLIERDGWPEVCTDPENGRVAFQNGREITEWLAHLADRTPERFERLVPEKGDTLLAGTRGGERTGGNGCGHHHRPRACARGCIARTIRRPHGRGDETSESSDAAPIRGAFRGSVVCMRRRDSGADSFWG